MCGHVVFGRLKPQLDDKNDVEIPVKSDVNDA